jgi:endonuclease-3 related protein
LPPLSDTGSIIEGLGKPSPYGAYKKLYARFGPQGWWPVTRNASIKPVYFKREYVGKSGREKFEICAGAILTQNTAWSNVRLAIANLKRAKALTLGKILKLDGRILESLIRPSGYFNQKAKRLRYFARYVLKNYGGNIDIFFDKPADALREELLSLNGIGPETADSMILYAAQKPSFVVDAYTMRLGQRLGWFGARMTYDVAKEYIVSKIPESLEVYNEFHALIVALGKDFCRKKPRCGECALKKNCTYGK